MMFQWASLIIKRSNCRHTPLRIHLGIEKRFIIQTYIMQLNSSAILKIQLNLFANITSRKCTKLLTIYRFHIEHFSWYNFFLQHYLFFHDVFIHLCIIYQLTYLIINYLSVIYSYMLIN